MGPALPLGAETPTTSTSISFDLNVVQVGGYCCQFHWYMMGWISVLPRNEQLFDDDKSVYEMF